VPDIFDEIEEDLRAERARQFLTRYSGLILALVAVIVIGVAGWQGWQWYQGRKDQRAAALYTQAMLEAAQPPGSKAALAAFSFLDRTAPGGYRTLARLQSAAIQAHNGQPQQALALWNQVAADPSADPLLRDLATLLWAQWQINSGDPGLLEARLRPLTELANPWRFLAEEQLALLNMRQGKIAQAKDELTRLSQDGSAPNGVRERASALLARLAG
jgi:hypothetical protein